MLAAGLDLPAQVDFADLRAALQETEWRWRPRLEGLLGRAQFVLGEEVRGFEAEFARAMRAMHAIAVSSGTSALELSLRAAKIRAGADEVITSPLTAPFTAVAIRAAGYKVRWADIDANTLLLDPQDAAARMTSRTGAIIPVHLYGQPYDVQRLSLAVASDPVPMIQDACQAHGADGNGISFTRLSTFVAYSFYPTKNLGGVGDGGAILTDDAAAARRLKLTRDGGRGNNHVSLIQGSNARLDEIQACFLRAFLPSLPEWNFRRRRLARLYEEALAECDDVRVVRQRAGSVYHLFVVRVKERDQLRAFLLKRGIETGIHYPVPLHRHPAFRIQAIRRGEFPNAERACREILSLPLRPQFTDDTVLSVAEGVRQFYSRFTRFRSTCP